MKLSVEGGEISLPEDFTFDIESNHPFFSDEGSSSVPVTVPASPENLRLLGSPDDVHGTKRQVREQTAHLKAGIFQKQCRLIAESAGKSSGISVSLGLLESEMYMELQDRRIPDIFAGKTVSIHGSALVEMGGPNSIYHGDVSVGVSDGVFAIFPVATDLDSDGNVFVLNKPKSDGNLEDSSRSEPVAGETVSVQAGYGITPFIYLYSFIRILFEEAGFTVRNNVFSSDTTLKKIVVVNNCADAHCTYDYPDSWIVHFSDIAPDMTVGEFIAFLHDAFGAYVTYDSGFVDIRLIRDDLAAAPDSDLSGFALDDETVSFPEPCCLKRSFDTSIDNAEPAAETLQSLREMYYSVRNVSSQTDITSPGLYYVRPLGRYFYRKAGQTEALGSNCFPYYREMDMSVEEISAENSYLPMLKVGDLYMPYIGARIHRYMDVSKDEEDQKQSLLLCYAHFSETLGHYCGSSFSYLENGTLVTDGSLFPKAYPELTPEGMIPYWTDYESYLVNGVPEIAVTLDIPFDTLLQMDRCSPKIYKGSKVLIKKLSYSVSDAGIARTKASLWVLAEYRDKLIVPPSVIFGTFYVWQLVTTREIYNSQEGIEIMFDDGLDDYTSADAPEISPEKLGMIAKKRKRWLAYTHEGHPTLPVVHEWEEYFISVNP